MEKLQQTTNLWKIFQIMFHFFQSWRIFVKSIKNGSNFYALKCDSEEHFVSGRCCMEPEVRGVERIAILGEDVDQTLRGKFYLYTDASQPKPTKEESTNCQWL